MMLTCITFKVYLTICMYTSVYLLKLGDTIDTIDIQRANIGSIAYIIMYSNTHSARCEGKITK